MFKLLRIRLYYLRLFRGIYIAYTLVSFFIVNWMSTHRWMHLFISRKYRKDGVLRSKSERLRMVIEKLGPTFVKFGQILADRPDIVSEKLRLELKKLQTMTQPISHDHAIRLIEDELGGTLDNFFIEFNREDCIGAASIGQVYQGRLKSGDQVVIKIQRPDIESKIELDLELLKYLAQELVEEYPGLTAVDVVGFVEEFGETLMHELNYVSEAANITRFGEIFKDVPYCKIPKVYTEYCTAHLLILEYVEGVNPDNIPVLISQGLDPKEIAVNGTHILMRMIFTYGFFHAGPHPGNLFIQPGNRIALIDFGMVGSLKPGHMHFLAGFTLGLARQDAHMISDSLITLCGKKFFTERDDFEFYVQDLLNRYGSFNYERIQFSQVLNDSIKIILRYQLKIPGSIYLLLKALATIEKFGAKLDPNISLPAIIQPYAEELIKKRFSPSTMANDLFDTIKDYVDLFRDFPSEMNEILFKMKLGKLHHEIHLSDQDIWKKMARHVSGSIGSAILICLLLAGSIILSVSGKSTWLGNLVFGITSFLGLWWLLRLFFRSR